MASVFISSPAEVVVIDSRTKSGTILLPITNSIPYRTLNFKDQYGSFSNSTMTLSTQVGESFDDGTTSKIFSNAYTYLSLYATSSKWMVLNATQTIQQTISSLTVNQLTFGTGAGWIQFGPVQASIVSSIQEQTQTAYIGNLLIGNLSTVNSAQYYGLFGNYNNTAIAEISTGAGTQELLVFKGSSASDRLRFQTTGNFVIETGVSARLWNSNTIQTLSNATPAFIINTSSNVGIQTAIPGATLDVAGTARAQILSSQQLFVSSLNGDVPLLRGNLVSTVQGLASAGYISTSQLISTTSNLVSQIQAAAASVTASQLTSTTIGLGSLQYISSSQLLSTTAGLIDVPELQSTIQGLGSSAYISSSQLLSTTAGLIDIPELQSTIQGLGSSGYISSSQLLSTTAGLIDLPELQSTIQGLGSSAYISSSQLVSTTAGLIDLPELQSTIQGLGSSAYISSSQLLSTTAGLIDLPELQSTIQGLGSSAYISSSQLVSTTAGLQSYISSFIDPTELASTVLSFISTSFFTTQMTSTVTGLGSAKYVSTASLVSTTMGLETFVSTSIQAIPYMYTGATLYLNYSVPVNSYRELGTQILPLAPQQTVTTSIGANTNNVFVAGFESDFAVPSFIPSGFWDLTVFTLASGTEVYMYASIYIKYGTTENLLTTSCNAPQLVPEVLTELTTTLTVPYSTISTSGTIVVKVFANHPAPATRTLSTLYQDGTYSHVHTTFGVILEQQVLTSTIQGLGTLGYVSTSQLMSTTSNILALDTVYRTSTSIGLGTLGYISSSQLISTTTGLSNLVGSNFTSTVSGIFSNDASNFTSTTKGLGTAGYISTPFQNVGFLSTATLTSTVQGLGSAGYISSLQLLSTTAGLIEIPELQSTVQGLGSASYISSSQLLSTTAGMLTNGAAFFTSTVQGLGSASYISSAQLLSTVGGLQSYISTFIDPTELVSTILPFLSTTYFTTQLTSTVEGLGSANFISSSQLLSTTFSYANYFQSLSVNTSSLSAVVGNVSSLTVNQLTFGDGNGWASFGAIQAVVLSSQQANVGNLYATNWYVGTVSTLNAIRFNGLFGNYNNTAIAEISTGAGTQELLLFKGSSPSDRIRFTTTGDIRFEPQVASQLFNNNPALAIPTMMLQSNLVGIGTVNPGSLLDVAGQGRFLTLSSQAIYASSIVAPYTLASQFITF